MAAGSLGGAGRNSEVLPKSARVSAAAIRERWRRPGWPRGGVPNPLPHPRGRSDLTAGLGFRLGVPAPASTPRPSPWAAHLTRCGRAISVRPGTGCMVRNWMLAALAVAVVLTGCGDGNRSGDVSGVTTSTPAALAPPSAPITTQSAPTTTVSERLAYWREVVKAMNCPEVTDLELKRLAGHFSDRAESLIAIHDRQGELSCA